MTRKAKAKANEEVIEVAQSIATAVQEDKPSTASKASKTQAKQPQPVLPPKVKEEVWRTKVKSREIIGLFHQVGGSMRRARALFVS